MAEGATHDPAKHDPTEHDPAEHDPAEHVGHRMTQGPDRPQQPTVPERSGATVAEAVDTASSGTPHDGVQAPVEQAKPHAAPVEQVRGDAEMTQGQVVDGPGAAATTPSNPDPAQAGSGGAQSQVGARVSDRVSAGEDMPERPGDAPT